MSSMFEVRSFDDGTQQRIVRGARPEFTDELGTAGYLKMEVPAALATTLAHQVEVALFLNGVEVKNSRARLAETTGNESEGDDAPGTGHSVTWGGKTMLTRLAKGQVYPEDWPLTTKEGHTFNNATPGTVMKTLLQRAQTRGACAEFTHATWSSATDSNGVAWSSVVTRNFETGKKLLEVLDYLQSLGVVDVAMVGRDLRLYDGGTLGTDRTIGANPVVLRRGLQLTDTPYSESTDDLTNALLVVGEDGFTFEHVDAASVSTWGRNEGLLSEGGTKDVGTLTTLADASLARYGDKRASYTVKVEMGASGPKPFVDYQTGDWVFLDRWGTLERVRIRQMSVTLEDDLRDVVMLTLNDKFVERDLLTEKRLSGIVGDNPDSTTPVSPVPAEKNTLPPKAPTGVNGSSTAYVDANGVVQGQVSLTWSDPTQNTDDTALDDLKRLLVYVRADSGSAPWVLANEVAPDAEAAFSSPYPPGEDRRFMVVAVDENGNRSANSTEYRIQIASDTTPPPVPSTPTAATYLGSVLLTWNGLGSAGESMPVDYAGCRIHVSTTTGFTPDAANHYSTMVFAGRTGTVPITGLPYGVTHYARLVTVDRSGNVSNPSAQVSFVPRRVVETDIEPGAITTGVVNFDARDLGAQQTFFGPSAPPAPAVDDFWVDSSANNQLKRWNGSAWINVSDTRIAESLTDAEAAAQSAQTALDAANAKVAVYFQTSAPTGLVAADVNDLWIDSDDNQKVYRWSGAAWVLTNLASTDYIASRATDLVTNGTGLLGNNTNFSGFTFDKVDVPIGAAGAFLTPYGVGGTYNTDEYIAVDPSKKYRFSFQAKQKGTSTDARAYCFVTGYDAYKNKIDPQHTMYQPNTLTTLAAPLNPGDPTITLTSSANWYGSAGKPAGASTHFRSIIWWDYVDAGGKAWPELTYSRNWSGAAYWADGGIVGNVITLAAPYSGPARAAGTKLSNGSSGGTYMYGVLSNQAPGAGGITTDWTTFVSEIKGLTTGGQAPAMSTGWPVGTAFGKVGWLLNRTVNVPYDDDASQHSIALVSVSDASAAQATADLKTTVFSQPSQPVTTGRTNGDMWYDTDDGNKFYVWTGSAWTVSQLGTQAVNFTARQIGAITTYWQASQPASGMLAGDLWMDTDDKNKVYRYSGTIWEVAQDQQIADAISAAAGAMAAADAKIRTFAQTTAPAGMVAADVGDLWVDIDDNNRLYRWDGDSWEPIDDARIAAQAAELASISTDLANVSLGLATTRAIADGLIDTFYQTAPPGVAAEGDVWVDTDDNNRAYRRSEAGAWVEITDDRVSKALTNAATAYATADAKIRSFYQASMPVGMTDADAGDLWFDTDDGNRAYWYRSSVPGPAGWVAVPFGGNAIAPGSISQSNLVTEIRAALGQVFFDDFSDLSRWGANEGSSDPWTVLTPSDAEFGNSVAQTDGQNTRVHTTRIPFDPTQLYRVTWRVRQISGVRAVSLGIRTYGADASTPVGASGGNVLVAASNVVPGAVFTTFTGFVKGTAVATGSVAGASDPKTPVALIDTTRYLSPLLISPVSGVATADRQQISMVKIEAVPSGLIERANIALLAVNSALIEDLAVVGAKIADLAVTNAKINDLAANKITTAELAAGVRVVAGPETGTHAELTATGFKAYIEDPVDLVPNEAVRIGTETNDLFALSDADGNIKASISDTGLASFSGLNTDADPTVTGYPLLGTYGATIFDLTDMPGIYGRDYETYPLGLMETYAKGTVAWYGGNSTDFDDSIATAQQRGLFELGFDLEPGRQYSFATSPILFRTTTAGLVGLICHYTTDGSQPTFASPILCRDYQYGVTSSYTSVGISERLINGNVSSQAQIRILVSILCIASAGNVLADEYITAGIKDLGPVKVNTGILRNTYVTGGAAPTTPTVRTYTATYSSTGSGTYKGDGTKRTDTSDVVQGYNSYNGDGKGLWIFPSVTGILSGATVNKIEVYAYANHWYYNSGGTALIKLHGYTSVPASSPAYTTAGISSNWPKPGGRWVTIPSTFYAGFKSGTYRGILMGPSGGTNLLYYGRFNGSGAKLRVTYTK